MSSYALILILVISSLRIATAIDYYVVPNGAHCNSNNTHELNYYLNKHFTSNSRLHFNTGEYYLENDFIMSDVYNISIIGHDVTIICHPYIGLTFINITNMTLECMSFMNCAQYQLDYFKMNSSHYIKDKVFTNKVYGREASIVFYNSSLAVRNVSILCRAGVHALMIINMMGPVRLYNISVLVKSEESSNSSVISSGVFFHLYANSTTNNLLICLKSLRFNMVKGSHNNKFEDFSFIAVKFMLLDTNLSVNVSVVDIVFANFYNSMALFYYVKFHGLYHQSLYLNRIQVCKNTGSMEFPLIYVIFHGFGMDFQSIVDCKHKSRVLIHNSTFNGNTNVAAIIHVKLKNTVLTATNITIHNCKVVDNINTGFVLTDSEINTLLQLTHTIKLYNVKIINNINNVSGVSLLSFAHCHPKFKGSIIIMGNSYYENIITLYFAALRFHGYISISKNKAYMFVNTLENSYFVLEEEARVEVTGNAFHSGIRKRGWKDDLESMNFYDKSKICIIQFFSLRGNLDNEFVQNKTNIGYALILNDNIITEPQFQARYDVGLSKPCLWLANMAFEDTTSVDVMEAFIKIYNVNNTKADVNTVESKLCYCTSNSDLNCSEHEVGPVFPGQQLKLPLMIPSLNSPTLNKEHQYIMLTARIQGMPPKGCTIENVSEIFQIHRSHGCNVYTCTIKYNSSAEISECELYLRTQQDDTEIVYVKLKPCPPGFVLENGMCICDPLLKSEPLSVSTCSLDNETILRPENSWITAEHAKDYSYTYQVSIHCPFHYCLPYPSNLNLSNPDSQCQYNRAGTLCSECQEGLSAVFGSFTCKHCTNHYLLIIVPFFIITFLVLALIFMFNLTIANGTINIFIFYIDIVTINLSIYFPHCQSAVCMFVSSNHQIDTCFYNGMSMYAKMWIYLCYPLYIILIAVLMIIASRHSVIFQRLTAQRALSVLATLFLLSFTGLLHTVALVLFYFKIVISIPGEHKTLIWAIDTNTTFLGPKFIVLYIVCFLFFLVLLSYNVLLLFTKELLQFKTVNKIKPFLDVYLGPYKHRFSYWTGLQLLIRIAISGLVATDRDVNLMTSTILLVVLLWIQAIAQPFKSKFQNFQQSLVLVDIIVINIISLYNRKNNHQAFMAISVLIDGGSFYFIAYIIFHCIRRAFGKTIDRHKALFMRYYTIWKQAIMNKKKLTEKRIQMASLRHKIADVTYNYQEFQEPLIEIDL